MRKSYVFREIDGEIKAVEVEEAAAQDAKKSHHIITDGMPATWHPADGNTYDSKSTFRRVTKSKGCVEVGDSMPEAKKPEHQPATEQIKRALDQSGIKTDADVRKSVAKLIDDIRFDRRYH